jgi:hypothetical protein
MALGDMTDTHVYHDHPKVIDEDEDEAMSKKKKFTGNRQLDDPEYPSDDPEYPSDDPEYPSDDPEIPTRDPSTPASRTLMVSRMLRSAQKGMPHIVSEFSWSMYNAYEFMMLPVYASYQGVAGITKHEFSSNTKDLKTYYRTDQPLMFRSSNSTTVMVLMRIAALMFIRGDIAPGNENHEVLVKWDSDELYENPMNLKNSNLFFKPGFPHGISLTRKVRVQYDADESAPSEFPLSPSLPYISDDGLSNAGELTWNTDGKNRTGYLKIEPKSQRINAVIGDLNAFHKDMTYGHSTKHLLVKPSESDSKPDQPVFGTVALISLDGRDIRDSAKMLLAVVGKDRNTGMEFGRYDDDHLFCTNMGTSPLQCERLDVLVQIQNLNVPTGGSITIYPLDVNGERTGKYRSVKDSTWVSILCENFNTVWYEVVVEPPRAVAQR